MLDESLLVDRQGPTMVVTMNRPERRNALSLDMIVRMADAWDAADADDSVRSVILTGAEDSYCVGGDLQSGWMGGNRAADPTDNEKRAAENPALIGKGLLLSYWLHTPLIAVVNGDCMGGGCEMLQQTDIRIAEEHARFGVPESSAASSPAPARPCASSARSRTPWRWRCCSPDASSTPRRRCAGVS